MTKRFAIRISLCGRYIIHLHIFFFFCNPAKTFGRLRTRWTGADVFFIFIVQLLYFAAGTITCKDGRVRHFLFCSRPNRADRSSGRQDDRLDHAPLCLSIRLTVKFFATRRSNISFYMIILPAQFDILVPCVPSSRWSEHPWRMSNHQFLDRTKPISMRSRTWATLAISETFVRMSWFRSRLTWQIRYRLQ